jgi:Ca2+/Na+ antiporter
MISKNQFVFAVFMFSYVLCTFLVGAIKLSYLDEILILLLTGYTFLFIIFKHQISKLYIFFLICCFVLCIIFILVGRN